MIHYAVVESVNGAVGFDTTAKINQDLAKHFNSIGYKFVVRYLTICDKADPDDLDSTEVQNIMSGKLMLMAVQHVRYPGWQPTGAMGTQDGHNASVHANNAGLIPGVTVWLDLEGVDPKCLHNDVLAYCRAWFNAVKGAGYLPGIYVGDNAILTGEELYALPFTRYWKSASTVPAVASRGYCMVQQSYQWPVYGIDIDRDTVYTDNLGGLPAMMVNKHTNSISADLTEVHDSINSIVSQLQTANNKISTIIQAG